MENIRSFRQLRVYKASMEIFELTTQFPKEETYSMVDQMRRSSRSVCANIAEAWRRRRHPNHFKSKLGDAESEAEETRVWIEFSYRCGSINADVAKQLDETYDQILGQLVRVISQADDWTIRP